MIFNYLVCCQYSEWVYNLFRCVDVCWFSGHEIEEAIELNVAARVGIDDRQDALEVNLTL